MKKHHLLSLNQFAEAVAASTAASAAQSQAIAESEAAAQAVASFSGSICSSTRGGSNQKLPTFWKLLPETAQPQK